MARLFRRWDVCQEKEKECRAEEANLQKSINYMRRTSRVLTELDISLLARTPHEVLDRDVEMGEIASARQVKTACERLEARLIEIRSDRMQFWNQKNALNQESLDRFHVPASDLWPLLDDYLKSIADDPQAQAKFRQLIQE
jgi:hypothetical protein